MRQTVAAEAGDYLSIEDLMPNIPVSKHSKMDAIYERGPEKVYLVVSGYVAVTRIVNDVPIGLGLRGTGDVFGLSCLSSVAANERAYAPCPGGAVLMGWTPRAVSDACATRASVAIELARAAIREGQALADRLAHMRLTARGRLCMILLSVAERFGVPSGGGMVMIQPMTHEYLASEVVTSREVVTKDLGDLRARGAITYNRQCIRVSTDRLRAVSRL